MPSAPSTPDNSPEAALYDPRSYLAQSVPKRMAIISAGVIMNVIFAFLMAVVAFMIGAPEMPCIVGEACPGYTAWQVDLRPGDEILDIAGKKMEKFRDLQTTISLGNIDQEKGVSMLVRRPGVKEPFTVTVKPDRASGMFKIGVAPPPETTKLLSNQKTWLIPGRHAVIPGSAAGRAQPAFCNGDQIVRIDDTPIENYSQINAELARKPDQKIVVVVDRVVKDAEGKPAVKLQRLAIPVEPDPMRHLGLVMTAGPVMAIQADSPASSAQIQVGDRIVEPAGDPMTLPDRLRREADKTVELTLQRGEAKTPIVCSTRLRQPVSLAPSLVIDCPVGASSLGVAYPVLNQVDRVSEGSPAAKAGMRPGDVLVQAKLIPPDKKQLQEMGVNPHEDLVKLSEGTIEFDNNKNRNWPSFINLLQTTLPGTKVELTYSREEEGAQDRKKHTVTMEPVAATDWHNPDRGFRFEPLTIENHGNSLSSSLAMGGARTLDDLTVVFRSVRALGTGLVPLRNLAGPWTIILVALQAADEGTVRLLLFLTFLSANLAVLNFMPIPVLDGGHIVLLAYEGIRGKPANEHVQTVLAYIGLALLLSLMIWVFGLDFGVFSRR